MFPLLYGTADALGVAEDKFKFNSIGNHIVELQDGTNLLVDAANHRLKVSICYHGLFLGRTMLPTRLSAQEGSTHVIFTP